MYENLKNIRKETHTPVLKLANLIGLETESAYIKKESGERKFSIDDGIKLANFFNKTVEELFYADELS